jgi:hypothetical protein
VSAVVALEHLSIEALHSELDNLQIVMQVGQLAGSNVSTLQKRQSAIESAILRLRALAMRAQGEQSVMLAEIAVQYSQSQVPSGAAVVFDDDE